MFKFIIKAISFVALSFVFGLVISFWLAGPSDTDHRSECTSVCQACQSCVDTQYEGVYPFVEVLPAHPEEQI